MSVAQNTTIELSAESADLMRKIIRLTEENGMGPIALFAEMFWCAMDRPDATGETSSLELDEELLESLEMIVDLIEETSLADEEEVAEMRLMVARAKKSLNA